MHYHLSTNCQWCQSGKYLHCRTGDYPDAHVYVPNLQWVRFTKRTDDPKLKWLELQLNSAGIPCRRRGFSFHAPILEVLETDLDRAWEILKPVDEMDDEHPSFVI